ncbi:MAG: hypothetical protein JWN56_68 [Sphingobacteriales bacterium]|nr:hypothetical protein [Sphingobacteriales bacterium]
MQPRHIVYLGLLLTACTNSTQTTSQKSSNKCDSVGRKESIQGTKKINIEKVDTISKTTDLTKKETSVNSAEVVHLFDGDVLDKLPKFTFNTITKSEFFSDEKIPTLITDRTKTKSTDSSFTVATAKAKLKFNKEYNKNYSKRDGLSWTDYHGFFDELKLYVLSSNYITEGLEFSSMFFIDSTTNVRYELTSQFDEGYQVPLLSPNNKFMVLYANVIATRESENSFIGVLKISDTDNVRHYKEFAGFTSTKWNIESVIWINETSFALKINRPKYSGDKIINNYSYLKATLPMSR